MNSINAIEQKIYINKTNEKTTVNNEENTLEFSNSTDFSKNLDVENFVSSDYELIYTQIENKIEQKKLELENKQKPTSELGGFFNNAKKFLGVENKETKKIEELEKKLLDLKTDKTNVLQLYEDAFGEQLSKDEFLELKESKNFVDNLDSQMKDLIKESLKEQVLSLDNYLAQIQEENGPIGTLWNDFKNTTGIGASSNKAKSEIENLLNQLNQEEDLGKLYKNLVGKNLTQGELEKFVQGESSLYESNYAQAVIEYANGQESCVDLVADITSGVVSFGCYSLALGGAIAAPFTGGASLALSAAAIGGASLAGGVTKTAIKGIDSKLGGREYSFSKGAKDFGSGAINGPLAALSAGVSLGVAKLGSKLGIGVAKTALQQAQNQIVVGLGKSVTKDVASTVFEAGIKNGVIGIGDQAIKNIATEESMRYAFKEANEQAIKVVAADTFGKLPNQSAINQISKAILQTNQTSTKALLEGATISKNALLAQQLSFQTLQNAAAGAGLGAVSSGSEYLLNTQSKDWNFEDLGKNAFQGAIATGASAGLMGALNFGAKNIIGNTNKNLIGTNGSTIDSTKNELALINDFNSINQNSLTKQPIITPLKPSELKSALATKDNIPDFIKSSINSIEKLETYNNLDKILNESKISEDKKTQLTKWVFNGFNDPNSAYQAASQLLTTEKELDVDLLSELTIKEYNKNQVSGLLNNTIIDKMSSDYIKEIDNTQDDWGESVDIEEKKSCFKAGIISEYLKYIDNKNAQYLNEFLTNNIPPSLLPYWSGESLEIYNNYLSCLDKIDTQKTFDIIQRRGHNLESIKAIFNDNPINSTNLRLLEFKDFDKFKDIDADNFCQLSTNDKKEFLNAYISSITQSDILYDKDFLNNYSELSSRMKIFSSIESNDKQELLKNYQDTLRELLNQIPDSDRIPIQESSDNKKFMSEYQIQNPIPAMTDDISKLDYRIETINNENYKVVTIDSKEDIAIATHGFPDGGILNIEALEITDKNEVLCVGLKSKEKDINFYGQEYALAIKPRLGDDWLVQASCDIDSGKGAQKNIFNINKYCLRITPEDRTTKYIPELIKKELDLTQEQYTKRMDMIKNCTTLDKIKTIDAELESAIRKVLQENKTYEGLVRPEVMGICVDSNKELSQIDKDILDYCKRRDIPIIQVKNSKSAKKSSTNPQTKPVEQKIVEKEVVVEKQTETTTPKVDNKEDFDWLNDDWLEEGSAQTETSKVNNEKDFDWLDNDSDWE